MMLVAAYVIGEIPALIAFGVDWLASRLPIGQQMTITGCASVIASMTPRSKRR
jgi:hypothetical protein